MKNDPLYTYLSIYHSELIEDDKLRSHDTAVISIPQMAPEGSILRNESAIDLLERVKVFNLKWIKSGHRRGDNTNNVSATISIDKTKGYAGPNKSIINEWEVVGDWMWENNNTFNGLSVLPKDLGSYIQAPFSDCTKEEYNKLISILKEINFTKVVELDDSTNFGGEVACGGSGCEVV